MFWNLYQQAQISEAKDSARRARNDAMSLRGEIRDVRRSLDSLTLTCAALWELLSEKNGLTEKELLAKMQEIDLRDGKLDGKMTRPASQCPSCQRANNPARNSCMYCGTKLPTMPM